MIYNNVSTYSKGKEKTENLIDKNLMPIFRAAYNAGTLGIAVILCGSWKGLNRHNKRMLARLFGAKNIVIAERDQDTANGLIKHARSVGYKGRIMTGDLFDILDRLHRAGEKISYVEADGVSAFGDFDKNCASFVNKHEHLLCMSINGVSRGTSDEFKTYAKAEGFRKTKENRARHYANSLGNVRLDQVRIVPQLMKKWLGNDWEYARKGYRGKNGANMYVGIVVPKGITLCMS